MSIGPNALLGVFVLGVTSVAASAFAQEQDAEAGTTPYELPPPFQDGAPPRASRPDPIPDGYHAEARARKDLIIMGSMLFGLPYTGSVVYGIAIASMQSHAETNASYNYRERSNATPEVLFVPVLGPFLALASFGEADTTNLLLDGIAQATGVAMIVLGAAWKKTVVVPDTGAQVTLAPMRFGREGSGLALVGTF